MGHITQPPALIISNMPFPVIAKLRKNEFILMNHVIFQFNLFYHFLRDATDVYF